MFISPWIVYTLAYSLQAVVSTSDFVHLPIRRTSSSLSTSDNSVGDIVKRDIDVDLPLVSDFFSITVGIGSSKQEISLILDTGSSDMIVISSDNPTCSTTLADVCKSDGTFNRNSSTSIKDLGESAFSIEYGDGTTSSGAWVQDTIDLNGVDVDLTFGLANNTDSTSVFGIGLQGLEFADKKYNNFPLQLKSQGLIDTSSYSVYLEYDKKNGDILFGAVDVSKIDKDNFYTIPMINTYAEYGIPNPIRTQVTMQGIGLQTEDGEQITISQTKVPALLDTGSTLSYLPTNIFDSIATHLASKNISLTENTASYGIDCSYSSDDKTLVVIDFGGFQIDIPLSQLIVNTTIANECAFGFAPNDGETVTLGDSFFSSAYVVFNLESYEISISPLQDNGTEANIKNINGTVPYAKKAEGYSNTWSAGESVSLGGDIFSKASEVTATATGSYVPTTLATVLKTESAVSISEETIASIISTKFANSTETANFGNTKWSIFDLGGEVMDVLNIIINAIAS